jgi:hypothetical protein
MRPSDAFALVHVWHLHLIDYESAIYFVTSSLYRLGSSLLVVLELCVVFYVKVDLWRQRPMCENMLKGSR